MISRSALLSDLQSLLPKIEHDLLERSESQDVPEVPAALKKAFEEAQQAQRTAQNYEDWRTDAITQAAAAWVLSCVFVRFLEDNRLIDPPRISGPADRLKRARDEREIYFKQHPHDRAYLLSVFDDLAKLPGTSGLFGPHNPIRELPNWLSGDAAAELIQFFQRLDPATGQLVHDFTDPASSERTGWDTRFLGDLYQDLSEAARKKYALLQTPEFVEEFILDRTLDPALEEFGLTPGQPLSSSSLPPEASSLFKMIDPACGSGHFLLGAFRRLLDRWRTQEPGTNARVLVQRALWSVHGVDVNPFAIAIARFRLLLAALKASGITKLAEAPAFEMNLVCGDSLLHGVGEQGSFGWSEIDHVTFAEDRELLRKILRPGTYHCVVANPPYITPKDRALNQAYRERYGSCHMKYSLAVPFMERIFRLAISGDPESERKALASGRSSKTPALFAKAADETAGGETDSGSEPGRGRAPTAHSAAGYTGQITANSFMKREFGKKLIEDFLPRIDLTHVIDTSGAYIPGHGTPTVILFCRNRKSQVSTIRTVMGIRGEPSTPDDPSRGLVWTAITKQIDEPGSQSEFVSASDTPRELFEKHPWSIGGGGASELKERLEELTKAKLGAVAAEIGVFGITAADDAMYAPRTAFLRVRVETDLRRRLVLGDEIRDWQVAAGDDVLFPYIDEQLFILRPENGAYRWLWPQRAILWDRTTFSKNTYREEGRTWWEWHQTTLHRLRTPLSIVFAFVASHNHFVLDRGGKVFKQTAPIIKLPPEATEDDHLALLGLLNSSTACFLMKQISQQRQLVGGDGVRVESRAVVPYEFAGTQLLTLPLPDLWNSGPLRDRLLTITREMDGLASSLAKLTPHAILRKGGSAQKLRDTWEHAKTKRSSVRSRMIYLQEEIDFIVYAMWGLADEAMLGDESLIDDELLGEGCRPFDILKGKNEDGFPVPSEIPNDWNQNLRQLWQRRIDAIRSNPELRLIEDAHYKRRWRGRQGLFNHTENQDELAEACADWLLDRLEAYFDFDGRMREGQETSEASRQTPGCQIPVGTITSVAKLADIARQDPAFLEVGELYTGDKAFDVQTLVQNLVEDESVPLLPVLRYKPSGLRKRESWEETWALQRREDAGEQNLKIPVPPKYTSADFLKSSYWRLRGKLDVPKERWVSFPHAEGPDGTLSIAWAGYDHLQLAQAISAWSIDIKDRHGGSADPRLVPLLASLVEVLPWLKQWHNEIDPTYQQRMGDFFEGFLTEESRELGLTRDELRNWQPPAKAKGRSKKTKGTT